MRFYLLLVLVFSFILVSCSEKDEADPVLFTKVDKVNGTYLINKEEHAAPTVVSGTGEFQYTGNRPTKRNGGYISISAAGGFSGIYVTDIYDVVHYDSPGKITITSQDEIENLTIYQNKREITLEKGLVIKKITSDEFTIRKDSDTIYYYYDAQNRLSRTEQFFRWNIITREYSFDSNGNLLKIVGIKKSRIDDDVYYTTEELFGGYDNKPNPLKGICLWQDLLYRTLSTNNFTTYSFKKGSEFQDLKWTLSYDSKGQVNYSH